MKLGLEGRRAIVTGGSKGLGFAIAQELVAEGADVAICSRDEKEVQAAADRLRSGGPTVYAQRADVTEPEHIRDFVARAAEELGGIDALVNNAGRAHPELVCGVLRLNPVAHEVYFNDDPLVVSPREFALLHALMEVPGAVLSRSELEQRLYGWGEEVESNAVEVHIHHLRKKMGVGVIRNVRGVGYMIKSEA